MGFVKEVVVVVLFILTAVFAAATPLKLAHDDDEISSENLPLPSTNPTSPSVISDVAITIPSTTPIVHTTPTIPTTPTTTITTTRTRIPLSLVPIWLETINCNWKGLQVLCNLGYNRKIRSIPESAMSLTTACIRSLKTCNVRLTHFTLTAYPTPAFTGSWAEKLASCQSAYADCEASVFIHENKAHEIADGTDYSTD